MIENETRVKTDYGVIPIFYCLPNMRIETKEGTSQVYRYVANAHGREKRWIVVNGYKIRFSRPQRFLQNDIPVIGWDLEIGDKIDTIDGPAVITDKGYIWNNDLYGTVLVNSCESNYILYDSRVIVINN